MMNVMDKSALSLVVVYAIVSMTEDELVSLKGWGSALMRVFTVVAICLATWRMWAGC